MVGAIQSAADEATADLPVLEALLKGVDQTVFLLNGTGEITRVHEGTASWMRGEKLRGLTLFPLFEEPDAEVLKQAFDQSLTAPAGEGVQKHQITLKPEHLLQLHEAGLDQQRAMEFSFSAIDPHHILFMMSDISESRQLNQKISQQAQRDPLTGAYNRRSLMTILQQSVAQALRYDWVCSFLLIDIDHFSDINDKQGLDAGDQVLQAFVTALHGFKRTADFFARYSDDRFVMFLPETNQDQAMLAAERVRVLAENLEIPFPTGDLSFTVSIGISTLMYPEDEPEVMLKRAEENLFIAKQSGSNRIEGEPI
ncbi:GGDEF domain-containing protein [Neptunomonas phycophila]|uniref:diguanylate cyclase n=3 Tax=Neptunomonas phycophila TaxID=1572645 RepID=A0ABT9EXN5_9GAMM|nr:GGDEF domain-containing protein [Neptunomonas phycophila]MDP2523709.1 GGDEF domain-containing protein [Neptunomonas phycophila]